MGVVFGALVGVAVQEWVRRGLNLGVESLKVSAWGMGALELEASGRNWREFGIDLQGRVIHAISAFQAAAA